MDFHEFGGSRGSGRGLGWSGRVEMMNMYGFPQVFIYISFILMDPGGFYMKSVEVCQGMSRYVNVDHWFYRPRPLYVAFPMRACQLC